MAKKDELSVRVATEADRDQLEQLISDCYSEVYPNWYDDEVIDAAKHSMLRVDANLLASGRYMAAEKGGKLAGCGGWSIASPGTGQIRHFATHPDFMRQGVGAAILNACFDAAAKEGVKTLQCFSSTAAEEFYARHGFERKQDVSIMLDGRVAFPAVLMEKTLG